MEKKEQVEKILNTLQVNSCVMFDVEAYINLLGEKVFLTTYSFFVKKITETAVISSVCRENMSKIEIKKWEKAKTPNGNYLCLPNTQIIELAECLGEIVDYTIIKTKYDEKQ